MNIIIYQKEINEDNKYVIKPKKLSINFTIFLLLEFINNLIVNKSAIGQKE